MQWINTGKILASLLKRLPEIMEQCPHTFKLTLQYIFPSNDSSYLTKTTLTADLCTLLVPHYSISSIVLRVQNVNIFSDYH